MALLSFTRDCLDCDFEKTKKEIAAILQLQSFDEMLTQLGLYGNPSSVKKYIDILIGWYMECCSFQYSRIDMGLDRICPDHLTDQQIELTTALFTSLASTGGVLFVWLSIGKGGALFASPCLCRCICDGLHSENRHLQELCLATLLSALSFHGRPISL